MPPRKPHPKGKLRGWEKLPTEPVPPEPAPDPEPTPDPIVVPYHAGIQFSYLHPEGYNVAVEEGVLRAYINDLRLWFWEKSGGLTFYHFEVYTDGVYPVVDGEPTIPFGFQGDPTRQWGSFAHYAQDYAGAIWRGEGELGMVLFDSQPHEGGYAGARLGHAAHGYWAIEAMLNKPFPEEGFGWQADLWPGTSLGGYAHELCHAFGDVGHWPGLMSEHWNWPNTYLDQLTIAEMEKSPWLARGPRPETGDWRRWA